MKWLNAIGLILQFVSFWFAAPELLRAGTLKRFENGLRNLISKLPALAIGLVGAGTGVGLRYGAMEGMQAAEQADYDFVPTLIIIGSVSLSYFLYMIFLNKRLQRLLRSRWRRRF
jgi:hypothetical protein